MGQGWAPFLNTCAPNSPQQGNTATLGGQHDTAEQGGQDRATHRNRLVDVHARRVVEPLVKGGQRRGQRDLEKDLPRIGAEAAHGLDQLRARGAQARFRIDDDGEDDSVIEDFTPTFQKPKAKKAKKSEK